VGEWREIHGRDPDWDETLVLLEEKRPEIAMLVACAGLMDAEIHALYLEHPFLQESFE